MLFTHEFDAMTNSEWELLPLINLLPVEYGKNIFVLLHIPLFAVLVALISSQNIQARSKAWFWISMFLVFHGVLHGAYMFHEKYEFNSMISNILIFGGAICGIAYLALNIKEKST